MERSGVLFVDFIMPGPIEQEVTEDADGDNELCTMSKTNQGLEAPFAHYALIPNQQSTVTLSLSLDIPAVDSRCCTSFKSAVGSHELPRTPIVNHKVHKHDNDDGFIIITRQVAD